MPDPSALMAFQPLTGAARRAAINNAGLISKNVAIVLVWLFVALAMCMAIARLVVRMRIRRKLYLDDYLVLIAVVMMIAAAAIFQCVSEGIYLYRAITKPNPAMIVPDADEFAMLMKVNSYTLSFVETSWTAIFAIKFSFLSLFHTLIRNLSVHLTRYYWAVVIFTVLSWAFLLTESTILCAHFGADALKCTNENGVKWTVLTALVSFLDVVTDLMVISFPILILRKSLMEKRQKRWIKFFLSLSVFMILIAVLRVLGGIRPNEKALDVTWQLFWQTLEGCVAVMAASATAMRSAFVRKDPHEYTPEPVVVRRKYLPRGFSLLIPTAHSSVDEKSGAPRIPTNVVKRDEITGLSGLSQWKMSQGSTTSSEDDTVWKVGSIAKSAKSAKSEARSEWKMSQGSTMVSGDRSVWKDS